MRHPALQAAVGEQRVEVVPMRQRDGPAAHHRAVAGRVGPGLLDGLHGLLPRCAARDLAQYAAGLDADVVGAGAIPGDEALGEVGRVQRAMGQEALGQGQGHLGVVGEGAGGQAAGSHVAHQLIRRMGGAELQGHAQRVADRRADGDAAQTIV